MYLDAQLIFSDAQAVTADAGSTNVIDTGPLFTGVLGRNLGVGERAFVFLTVDVALTDSGSTSYCTVTLETDETAAFSTAATVATLFVVPALTAAGATFFAPLPVATLAVPYERFIRLKYTMTNGDLSTGSFTAGITKDIQAWVSTVGGFSTGI